MDDEEFQRQLLQELKGIRANIANLEARMSARLEEVRESLLGAAGMVPHRGPTYHTRTEEEGSHEDS